MSNAIIDGTNIDLSVLSYSAPKPNPSGGKVVNLYNKYSKESLTISAPLMGSWGAQEVKTLDGTGLGKYTMTLQFSKGQYTTPEADKFLEQMKKVESKIKEDAILYSKEWFGKEIKSMDVMDEKFTPMLKYPKKSKGSEERNYNEPPQLNLKLPCWKGVWQPSVFDEDYNPLYVKGKTDGSVTPLDFLKCPNKAPIQIMTLIQCAGLWFVGSPAKVSITWNLKQVIVRKPRISAISDDTCFLTMKPTDKEISIVEDKYIEHIGELTGLSKLKVELKPNVLVYTEKEKKDIIDRIKQTPIGVFDELNVKHTPEHDQQIKDALDNNEILFFDDWWKKYHDDENTGKRTNVIIPVGFPDYNAWRKDVGITFLFIH